MTEQSRDWRDVLWREWRNCEDKEYADHLYKSVVNASHWPVAILRVILDSIAGIGCVWHTKLHNYDPSEYAPFSIGMALGLTTGLVTGVLFGVGPGLVFGLIVGATALYALMLILTVLPRWRERVAVLFDRLCKWEEPEMAQVEMALREAVSVWQPAASIWAEPLRQLQKQKQQPDAFGRLITDLQRNDWVARFVAGYGLVSLGGVAVEALQAIAENRNVPLNRLAIRLLKNIEIETTTRWAKKVSTLLCPHCLVRCHAHVIPLSWQSDLIFYGCRVCNQSREFLEGINHVVAVLDAAWPEVQLRQNETVGVNWLQRRTLFDFDQVEIIQATDEEVERFAVQVGNDTDSFRRTRYQQMRCIIAPECQLSENTRRILVSTFGQVESEQVSS